jgi:hypothetical protein
MTPPLVIGDFIVEKTHHERSSEGRFPQLARGPQREAVQWIN